MTTRRKEDNRVDHRGYSLRPGRMGRVRWMVSIHHPDATSTLVFCAAHSPEEAVNRGKEKVNCWLDAKEDLDKCKQFTRETKGVRRNCAVCEAEFYIKPSQVKLRQGQCCSRECADRYRIQTNVSVDKKRRAAGLIDMRVRRGLVERPDVCANCGDPCKPQGHHEDYDKPDQVEWLCLTCHQLKDELRRRREGRHRRETA